MNEFTRCMHCGCYINLRLGEDSPAEHAGNEGTKDDPRAPGEWNDICDVCNYDLGLRGGPRATPTYDGDYSEWELDR